MSIMSYDAENAICYNNISDSEDAFDRLKMQRDNARQRALANRLANDGGGLLWTDQDIDLLLDELEIEVGEGTNRFLYQDERLLYCYSLSHTIPFNQIKTPQQIYDKIIWLWTTWEAISRATGKSWWNISEQDKFNLSLLSNDKDQLLKSKFKYFDKCDRTFAYIHKEEGEDEENNTNSIYY